jgi:hypothetical protein
MRELRALRPAILAGSVFIFCLLLGCTREQRNFREATPSNETGEGVQMSDIAPGHSADRKPNANPY